MDELKIIFEDSELLVLDKPAGLVVNRGQTVQGETLQELLENYFSLPADNLGIGGRAGIVHRLDRDTSGVLAVAKSQKAFENLQKQFKEREVEKKYVALVHGLVADHGVIDEKIGRVGKFGKFGVVSTGRESKSEFKRNVELIFLSSRFAQLVEDEKYNKARIRYLEAHGLDYSLVEIFPKTGRTHQIRVHLKHLGHPVVSDELYCPSKLFKFDMLWCPRMFLHAQSIAFRHPSTKKNLEFVADLPKDLKSAMLFLASRA